MTEAAKLDPPDVFAAVATAMGEVKRIAKDNRNSEQKYNFASIDDFMAMVGPICAKNGLVTIADEESVEPFEKQGKFGVTQWARFTYVFTTYHVSGSHLPPVHRRVEVIRSGPQAYGAAQSYSLKQYYRGLFCIPTGDKDDPDFGDHDSTAHEPARRNPPPHETDPRDAKAAFDKLHGAETQEELRAIWSDLPADVKRNKLVEQAKEDRKRELSPPNAAKERTPLVDDAIPY